MEVHIVVRNDRFGIGEPFVQRRLIPRDRCPLQTIGILEAHNTAGFTTVHVSEPRTFLIRVREWHPPHLFSNRSLPRMGSPAFAAFTETAPGVVITAMAITNTEKQVNATGIVVLARLAFAQVQT